MRNAKTRNLPADIGIQLDTPKAAVSGRSKANNGSLTQITFLAYLLQIETRVFVVIGRLTPGATDGHDVL
jgi:hypothetical protein